MTEPRPTASVPPPAHPPRAHFGAPAPLPSLPAWPVRGEWQEELPAARPSEVPTEDLAPEDLPPELRARMAGPPPELPSWLAAVQPSLAPSDHAAPARVSAEPVVTRDLSPTDMRPPRPASSVPAPRTPSDTRALAEAEARALEAELALGAAEPLSASALMSPDDEVGPAWTSALGPPPDLGEDGPTNDLCIPRAVHTGASEPTSAAPQAAVDERRASRRHRLVGAAVRATVHDPGAPIPTSRGRVRDISADGGLFVETRTPLATRSVVRVGLAVAPGRAMRLTGTVVRSGADGMALLLRLDADEAAFLNVFVAVAREARRSGALDIRVDRVPGDATESAEIVLAATWQELRAHPDDPQAHQRFLDACVSAQRMDYALSRLRELKQAHPHEPRVDRSLEHVGQVLGFVALTRTPTIPEPTFRSRPYIWLVVLLLAALTAAAVLARRSGEPSEPATHSARPHVLR
jgi:hypothetical protein